MSISSNAALANVTASGRTLTPSGVVFIGDARPRAATGSFTFTNGFNAVDGAIFDCYALIGSGNIYTFLALPTGTSVAGRRDVAFLGQAVDYPSLGRTEWIPVAGGAKDNAIAPQSDGSVKVGAASAGSLVVDRFGRLGSGTSAPPSVVLGTGAGGGGPSAVAISGSDQWGIISVITGMSPPPAASQTIVTLTFNQPYLSGPYGAVVTPYDFDPVFTQTQWMDASRTTQNISTTALTLVAGANALQPGYNYRWSYVIMGRD